MLEAKRGGLKTHAYDVGTLPPHENAARRLVFQVDVAAAAAALLDQADRLDAHPAVH